jgi:signal transduction histidine kinase/CHASE1-domain containing sensor protein
VDRTISPRRRALRAHVAPAIVLATGIVVAVVASMYVRRAVDAQQEARFREIVGTNDVSLRQRMDAYIAQLRAARGLLEVLGRDPTRAEFRRFVATFDLRRRYPGIQGIGWSKALRQAEAEPHEAAMRAAGFRDYGVWPEGDRDFYTSIVHLEPLDWRNRRAIGFDMFSEPTRRAAMERARDTGEIAASGRVELVQESGEDRQAGFLMYLPVYSRPPVTIEERRSLLRGWVYAPFRAADLLHGTLGAHEPVALGLAVYDGSSPDLEALLYDARAPTSAVFRTVRGLEIGGRSWTLHYAATHAFATWTERALPGAVFVVGLGIALLLFWVVRADAQARTRAEAAALRASFLAEAGRILSSSTDHRRALSQMVELATARIVDACLVHLLDDGAGPVWLVAHREPAAALQASRTLSDLPLGDDGGIGAAAALRTGEAQLRPSLDLARLATRDAARLGEALGHLGAKASLAVPFAARGEPLGVILLVSTGRRLVPEDVALGVDLARMVSATVDTSRLYQRAQEAVAARDDFLSIASHELKTPLTSLVLLAGSLRAAARRGQLESAAVKSEAIRRNVDRLSRLVANLLDISRIGAGRLDVELEEVDLGEVAQEVTTRFEDEARRSGCTLRIRVAEPVRGRWDRMRLDQVVTNLVSNAIKYGPGKPVEISVEADGDLAILSVRDHGIGIPEADQRRIFHRFERAVSRRNYGGFGLGLWIVRQIVEALGGAVRVESAPGEGSTFTVQLERATADRRAAAADQVGAPG